MLDSTLGHTAHSPRPVRDGLDYCPMLETTAPTIHERLRNGESALTDVMAKSTRCFAAKSLIVEEGNRPTHVFRVISGRATRRRMLADGRSQLMSIVLPGDIVGVRSLFEDVFTDTIEAVSDLVVH